MPVESRKKVPGSEVLNQIQISRAQEVFLVIIRNKIWRLQNSNSELIAKPKVFNSMLKELFAYAKVGYN